MTLNKLFLKGNVYFVMLAFMLSSQVFAHNSLVKTVVKIKPSIVGVGTYNPTSAPQLRLLGTGFAILDGHYIVTNDHVVPKELNEQRREKLVVFIGTGNSPKHREAKVVAYSREHDLAILKIGGKALPTFKLGKNKMVPEGADIAFTGFPIGAILGLYPVTHRGIIASHTPIVIPAATAKNLTLSNLKRLKNPYLVYQLDATAYPGNSGSPMYDPNNGVVSGVINRVFIKETKESVLEKPSGISYAIPVKYLHQLINRLPKK